MVFLIPLILLVIGADSLRMPFVAPRTETFDPGVESDRPLRRLNYLLPATTLARRRDDGQMGRFTRCPAQLVKSPLKHVAHREKPSAVVLFFFLLLNPFSEKTPSFSNKPAPAGPRSSLKKQLLFTTRRSFILLVFCAGVYFLTLPPLFTSLALSLSLSRANLSSSRSFIQKLFDYSL